MITLVVARVWSAEFIWRAHAQAAIKAGVSADVVAAIEKGVEPGVMPADERTTYDLMLALLSDAHVVDDALFERVRVQFGRAAVVEMVTVAGYYTMNAMICKTFTV